MYTENEIRERVHVATLELLQMASKLTDAHQVLLMRHFEDARLLLHDIRTRLVSLLNFIPEEDYE